MALAATVLPDCVYWVLAVVWIVTELPLGVLATIVLPFTLDTVSASHWPCAPGVAASAWALLKSPWATACVWEPLEPPCVTASVWALLELPDTRAAPGWRRSMNP